MCKCVSSRHHFGGGPKVWPMPEGIPGENAASRQLLSSISSTVASGEPEPYRHMQIDSAGICL